MENVPKLLYSSELCIIEWHEEDRILYNTIIQISDSEEELSKAQNALSKIYKQFFDKNIKFSQIYDAKELILEFKSVKNAYKFASFLKSQDVIIETICDSVSVINKNTFARTIINSYLKLFVNKIPVKLVDNRDDAHEFVTYMKKQKVDFEFV